MTFYSILFHFVFLRQGLTLYLRLAWNLLCSPGCLEFAAILHVQLVQFWNYRYEPCAHLCPL